MIRATEVQRLNATCFVWHLYDPAVKAELFSTGTRTAGGVYLVDPVPVDDAALQEALGGEAVCGVVVTNENHARAAAAFARAQRAPIFAHADALVALSDVNIMQITPGVDSPPGFTSIAIRGAPAGEVALHDARDGGTLILGDALINFGSSGFAFLPAKYCTDSRQMQKSLRQLLDFEFERLLFAHGSPITTRARSRLQVLLEGGANNATQGT